MIRLALVGCGGISKSHASRFQENSDLMKVVATVDVVEQNAREAAEVIGAEKYATDFREILPEVDAVLLALPHHLHHSIGMECLQAGKHVLMEKPLANTEQECIELIEESEKQGVILMTAYCMRYHPLVIRMKELIDEKKYGETFHVSIWTEQFTKYPEGHWINNSETLGGGQLFSHGCHYIDILLHFLGNPVEGSHIGTTFGTPWMEGEGTSDVSMKFDNGASAYHGGTWGARGSRLHYGFHAHGTEGFMEADFRKGQLIEIQGVDEKVIYETETGKHVENEMRHFLECIKENKQPITDGPSSLQGLRVIWRMYEAEKERRIADLTGLGLNQPWRAVSAT